MMKRLYHRLAAAYWWLRVEYELRRLPPLHERALRAELRLRGDLHH